MKSLLNFTNKNVTAASKSNHPTNPDREITLKYEGGV